MLGAGGQDERDDRNTGQDCGQRDRSGHGLEQEGVCITQPHQPPLTPQRLVPI